MARHKFTARKARKMTTVTLKLHISEDVAAYVQEHLGVSKDVAVDMIVNATMSRAREELDWRKPVVESGSTEGSRVLAFRHVDDLRGEDPEKLALDGILSVFSPPDERDDIVLLWKRP